MSMHKPFIAAVCVMILATCALTATAQMPNDAHFDFGTPIKPEDMARYFSIPPSGRGLPPGSGTAEQGAKVYAENCVACHGERLEGNPQPGVGGDKLIGGRGSLATQTPVKTVESYWPYATTLFDWCCQVGDRRFGMAGCRA